MTGVEAQQLSQMIIERLRAARLHDRGWGYFLDSKDCELLPSAYAIRGLAAHNHDVERSKEWVLDSLKQKGGAGPQSHADVTTAVACVYCLTFCKGAARRRTVPS